MINTVVPLDSNLIRSFGCSNCKNSNYEAIFTIKINVKTFNLFQFILNFKKYYTQPQLLREIGPLTSPQYPETQ